jgi:hypothetical protein
VTASHSNGQRDDMPITLAQAAEIFGIGVATLRAERNRGRLHIFRIGRQDMTTIADMREMVALCRDAALVPACTSISREVRRANTSSETAAVSLDSAQQALLKLRNSLRNTSPASTGRSQARVR